MFTFQEKTGIWYIYYENPRTGKRTKKSTRVKSAVGSKPPIKVMQKFVKFQKEFEVTRGEGVKSILLSDFINIFANYKKNFVCKNTLREYITDLKQLDEFLNKKIKLNELRQQDIENYTNHCFNKGYALVSIEKKLVVIFSAIKYAKKCGFISKDVDLERCPLKPPQTPRKALSESEFLELLSNCKELDLRDILLVAYMTGMRMGEIRNLQWRHLDIEKGFFYLDNTTFLTKTRKIRAVPMTEGVIEIIRRRLYNHTIDDNSSEYIFTIENKKWTGSRLHRRFIELVKQTPTIDQDITFHCLRHSFATNLMDMGVDTYKVKELLGHSSISTTQLYLHLRPRGLKEAVKPINIKNIKIVERN